MGQQPEPARDPAPDTPRIGQQGLAIVVGVARTFAIERGPAGKRITAAIALTDG
ncbi:hypothetical protein ACFWUW_17300 [Streptomyces sp. NPDC058655]|uniref:hypothetical protein n=1 Tax=unclassified Streptomyces TaxID=2593676 RepID=UPI00364EA60C